MAVAADDVVKLKRRVRNDHTELFEWRKCECSLTGNGQLVLQTVGEDDTDQRPAEDARDAVDTSNTTARVVIDLAWQLHALEQKRKCKTRCELQYVVNNNVAIIEELMAPSPRHCQQWIELVREAEKRAKRRESIRQGTATATAVAAMSSALAASSSSVVFSGSPLNTSKTTPFDASLSSVSMSSLLSSAGPPIAPTPAKSAFIRKETPPKQRAPPSCTILSQWNQYDDSYGEQDNERQVTALLPSSLASPFPQKNKIEAVRSQLRPQDVQRTAETTYAVDESLMDQPPRRPNHHQYGTDHDDDEFEDHREQEDAYDDDDYEDDYVDDRYRPPLVAPRVARTTQRPSLHATVSAMPRRKKSPVLSPSSVRSSFRMSTAHAHRKLSPPSSSALSSDTFSPTSRLRRPLSTTLLPASSSAHRRPSSAVRATAGASSAAVVAASIQRLRRHEGHFLHESHDDERQEAHGDTREELDILMRVESALRHLERENAAAKDREAALAHQVSSLQDALRVRSAEKKHLEAFAQQLTRDKDAWKLTAQRAEHTLAQLQDELAIAQEESQLQHSERHRLTHHNKELLSQVHRLDSIVYGRF